MRACRRKSIGREPMEIETSKIMCPECQSQGLVPAQIDELDSIVTLAYAVPFYDKDSKRHIHDINRHTMNFRCCNGHRFKQVIPNTCWCGWKQEERSAETSATWNASVPTNTTIKIEAPTPRLDPAWEIVKELSENNGTPSGSMGKRCLFCNALDDSLSNLRHKDTCLISRAYKLVWQKENEEWHEQKSAKH